MLNTISFDKQTENNLRWYTKNVLVTGAFLFLDRYGKPIHFPYPFEVFSTFLINAKHFNPNNISYIQYMYSLYTNVIEKQEFINDPRLNKKSAFSIIKNLNTSSITVQYYIDRGYAEEDAKYKINQVQSKNGKTLNDWEQYINLLKLNSTRTPACCIKPSVIETYPMLLLFYDIHGYRHNIHIDFPEFSKIMKHLNVNTENFEFLNKLYAYYKSYDLQKYVNIDVLKRYNLFFRPIHHNPPKITPVKYEYWISRGYSKDEAIHFVSEFQKSVAVSIDGLKKQYGQNWGIHLNEYIAKMRTTRALKKAQNPMYGVMFSKTINPETGKFYEGEALIKKRKEVCKNNYKKASLKTAERIKSGEIKTVWQPEFWIERGLSHDEAVQKIYSIMAHNGLDWYIEKYGEDNGPVLYQDRIARYKKTMSSKSPEEQMEINKKKTIKSHKVSKSSIIFFNKLITILKNNYRFELSGVYMNDNEYYLYDGENKTIYFYDFCIPSEKIIIEFNGIMYHPHYSLSPEEVDNWKSLFYNIPGNVQRTKDMRKREIAEQHGFKYLVIWDNDNQDLSLQKAIDFIIQNNDVDTKGNN